jgi:hypothetical protein
VTVRALLLRARGWLASLLMVLPDRWVARRLPAQFRFDPDALPAPVRAPDTPVRLLVAPANYAGQGDAWARAAERVGGVGAVAMVVRSDGDLGFAADYEIGLREFRMSYHWSRAHRRAVVSGFTHVLFEAERPLLGRVSGFDVEREARDLARRGIVTAFVSHGSDLRLPSRHAAVDPWTPFDDPQDPWVAHLEARAARNGKVLDQLRARVFVPTPELLLDRPDATWLPIVVDPERWASPTEPLRAGTVSVLHVPTSARVKGSDLIEPQLRELADAGTVRYVRPDRVAPADMPDLYRSVDVVLEQFRLGIYATTAIEAMAAGRVVVGHVRDQVRDHVRAVTGLELPVVEATPDTIGAVLRDIVARPEHYREVAARGPMFVAAAHDGTLSAAVLRDFLESRSS